MEPFRPATPFLLTDRYAFRVFTSNYESTARQENGTISSHDLISSRCAGPSQRQDGHYRASPLGSRTPGGRRAKSLPEVEATPPSRGRSAGSTVMGRRFSTKNVPNRDVSARGESVPFIHGLGRDKRVHFYQTTLGEKYPFKDSVSGRLSKACDVLATES